MRLKNTNPLGDVDIPGIGTVEAGAEVEVPDELAKQLLDQVGNYEAVVATPTTSIKKKG